jgi:hypothetical protein
MSERIPASGGSISLMELSQLLPNPNSSRSRKPRRSSSRHLPYARCHTLGGGMLHSRHGQTFHCHTEARHGGRYLPTHEVKGPLRQRDFQAAILTDASQPRSLRSQENIVRMGNNAVMMGRVAEPHGEDAVPWSMSTTTHVRGLRRRGTRKTEFVKNQRQGG